EDAITARAVADGVDEVDHLRRNRVADGEVAAAEQLAEVQPVVGGGVRGARHSRAPYAGPVGTPQRLERLEPGQLIVVGSDRAVVVTDELAAVFSTGDRLVVLPDTGDVLHIPAAEHEAATKAVSAAYDAFHQLSGVTD